MIDRPPPRVLSIAGSDSSGGAGIQADIKTITMLGGYAMTAITAITAQNSTGVQAIAPLSADMVGAQIESCVSDIGIDSVKIGMLHDIGIVEAVDHALAQLDAAIPVILDPVMVSTSGATLIAQDAIAAIREKLFSRAMLITPNLPELAHLAGRTLEDTNQVVDASLELADAHGCCVLAKGGHTEDERIIDILIQPGGRAVQFEHTKIASRHTHGTGCTLSSAIATLVGHGQALEHAVRLGRQFVLAAIKAAPGFGAGHGPLGHQAVRNTR